MNKDEEKGFLSALTTWNVVEEKTDNGQVSHSLHRVYEFKDFNAAYSFMGRAVEEIIRPQDHHPRWENTYNRVEIWLTTFSADMQITEKDTRMAKALEELWLTFQQR